MKIMWVVMCAVFMAWCIGVAPEIGDVLYGAGRLFMIPMNCMTHGMSWGMSLALNATGSCINDVVAFVKFVENFDFMPIREMKYGVPYSMGQIFNHRGVWGETADFRLEDNSTVMTRREVRWHGEKNEAVTFPDVRVWRGMYFFGGNGAHFNGDACFVLRERPDGPTFFRSGCTPEDTLDPDYEVVPGKMFPLSEFVDRCWFRGDITGIMSAPDIRIPVRVFTVAGKTYSRLDMRVTAFGVKFADSPFVLQEKSYGVQEYQHRLFLF